MDRLSDWDLYRKFQKAYRDSVVTAKRESWRKFCESVEEVPETSRLCRILTKNLDSTLQAIRLPERKVALEERCLIHLLEINFPDFKRRYDVKSDNWVMEHRLRARGDDRDLAACIVKPERVKWAVRSFKPFKFPGPYGIFSALL